MSDSEWTEEKFRALTMLSGDIISLLDGQGRLLFNSPATLRINGFSPEELQDKDTFELIHPDDRAAVAQVFAEVLATPGKVVTTEYRYLTKDGRWLWMEAVASNQLHVPAVQGVVTVSRDVSERKRAEAERLRLEQQLLHTQKLESLGVMAGGVAHDFNNLLAIILSEASILERRIGENNAVAAESITSIVAATERAAELTRQLLAYAGRSTAPRETTDLRQLIIDLAPLMKLSSRGGVEIVLELETDVPTVRCDQGQLRQILINLVLNAAEASHNSGEVKVRLQRRDVSHEELSRGPFTAGFAAGPAAVIEVSDAGTGMTPETCARIFDPFFSTKQSGRGLGLAAVCGIVRSHHAALSVESEPGRGSTFRLYLHPDGGTPSAKEAPQRARFAGRVLVVDDEPMVARTAARALSELGFQCAFVTDGDAALEAFRDAPSAFTFVLCDMLMPRTSGPETVRRLRELRSDTPVLFVSGYSPEPGAAPHDDQTGFLAKPFATSALTCAIRQLVPGAEVQD